MRSSTGGLEKYKSATKRHTTLTCKSGGNKMIFILTLTLIGGLLIGYNCAKDDNSDFAYIPSVVGIILIIITSLMASDLTCLDNKKILISLNEEVQKEVKNEKLETNK
jgi:hypothetical protein